MSDQTILKEFEKCRDAILLAEIGVWWHLLGKLSDEFIHRCSETGAPPRGVGKGQPGWIASEALYSSESIFENPDPSNAGKPPEEQRFPQTLNPLNLPSQFFGLMRHVALGSRIQVTMGTSPKAYGLALKEFVKSPRDWSVTNEFLKLLVAAHHISGAEEKQSPASSVVQKSGNQTFASTAFGFEKTKPICDLANLRHTRNILGETLGSVLDEVSSKPSPFGETWWASTFYGNPPSTPGLFNSIKLAYEVTVGETRRPVNDVTLWDATSLAAALFKSALAQMVLDGWKEPIDPQKKSVLIKWRILRVNLDTLGFMAKGIKVGDILGYRERIDSVLNLVKRMMEVKYLLGNEVYRDTTGIYFSFPNIEDDSTLQSISQELRRELYGAMERIEPEFSSSIEISGPVDDLKDLTAQRQKALESLPFQYRSGYVSPNLDHSWSPSANGSEVCPICRLRPMIENSDGCEHCLKRRVGRAQEWLQNPTETIWLDEVADHNDRIALIVGTFDLTHWLDGSFIETLAKKPASSGRVRRVWETTERFIAGSIIEEILRRFPYAEGTAALGLRRRRLIFRLVPNPSLPVGATCEFVIDNIRLSPVCVDRQQGLFVTTENLQIYPQRWRNTREAISEGLMEKGRGIRVKIQDKGGTREQVCDVLDARLADESYQYYNPFISLYTSPDQFMALVPAWDALAIAERIVQAYEVQFSKVRDRLAFHLGVIAFHRRLPLYVAMDAGRRLLDEFQAKAKRDTAQVTDVQNVQDQDLPKHLQGLLTNQVRSITLSSNLWAVPVTWYVSCGTNDPYQPDDWHPYFRIQGQVASGTLSFPYGSGHCVHVKALDPEATVSVEPGLFALEHLESSADRFRIGDSIRPLEDLQRIQDLWREVESRLRSGDWSVRQVRAFIQQALDKRDMWGADTAWDQLIGTTLQNTLGADPNTELGRKILQGLRDRTLIRCLDWYLRVRKTREQQEERVAMERERP